MSSELKITHLVDNNQVAYLYVWALHLNFTYGQKKKQAEWKTRG